MVKTLPITQARNELPTLVNRAQKLMEEYVITVKGKPTARIMSQEQYESIIETMDILSDPELMESIRQGEKEIAEGKVIPWEEVEKELFGDVQTNSCTKRPKKSKKS